MKPTETEKACFEAGIKLGALYHQFTGTPLSRNSVSSLETAIEEAVKSQRYVSDVDVEIGDLELNRFGYTELEGTMMDIDLTIEFEDVVVKASMSEDEDYPMMRIDDVKD